MNELSEDAAREALARCCGSERWVAAMLARRPFESTAALFEAAREIWQRLERQDYLEAFAQHPRLGESLAAAVRRWPRSASMIAHELRDIARANPELLQALREENERYSQRFGYNFVVSTTGKSAQAVLQELRARLANEPDRELEIAAEEQARITSLRLARLA